MHVPDLFIRHTLIQGSSSKVGGIKKETFGWGDMDTSMSPVDNTTTTGTATPGDLRKIEFKQAF
jgi:hypothetical protein